MNSKQVTLPVLTVALIASLLSIFVMGDSGRNYGGVDISKPGNCPPSDPQLSCYVYQDLCTSDCDCPQKEKCCFQQNCGSSCKNATDLVQTCGNEIVSTRPGLCPKPNDYQCIWCYDNCVSDCQCNVDEKCCKNSCGNTCSKLEPQI